jgi:beta-glucosidase-like glycosyl hydrolase/LysM repeat protein
MIAVSQGGSQSNILRVPDLTPAMDLGASNDVPRAHQLGRQYGVAAKAFGVNVILGPMLDVYDPSTAFPNLRAQSFGDNQTQVAALGLAMAQGMREGGVISVAKSFPGYAAAGYSSDGVSVVMNQEYNGLAKAMYPFNEATRSQLEGLVVGHIAVPLIDKDFPTRPAALSPLLVTELLRNRWAFQGVIVADEIAFNEMTRARPAERAVVEALIAGCDTVLFLDPSPTKIRAVVEAIDRAVEQGELTVEQLDASKARLEKWRLTLGAVAPEPVNTQVAMLQELAGETTTAVAVPEVVASTPVAEPEMAEPEMTEPEPAAAAVDEINVPVETTLAPPEVAEPDPVPIESIESAPEVEGPAPIPVEKTPAPMPEIEPEISPEPETVDPEPEPIVVAEEESVKPVSESIEGEVAVVDPEPMPETTAPEVSEAIDDLANAVDDSGLNQVKHTVVDEESILQITWKYDVSTDDILRWNSLDSMSVEPGTVLDIYTAHEAPLAEAQEPPATPTAEELALRDKIETALMKMKQSYDLALARTETKTTEVVDEVTPEPEEMPETPVEPKPDLALEKPVEEAPTPTGFKFVHLVKWGDTLSSIASDYSVSIADIRAWNKLNSDTLQANTSLLIYVDSQSKIKERSTVSPEETENVVTYVVESGDTVSKIARKHNTTSDKLMKLNKLKDANSIRIGQKLKVPAT